ncbi:MAG TPA: SDR family oxidoreductase [Terriglobales bacterium]|nr:SDR family oxidoreductase [Terriglobales bacterium]
MRLQNKVAVITGGSMGIGEAMARLFVAEGALVVITSRDLARAESARQRIGAPERTLALACDVRRRGDLENLGQAGVARFGRIDIWVNNAGHGLLDSVEKMKAEDYRSLFDTNVFGAIDGMQIAIAQMRKQGGGTIINVSSVAGIIAVPFMPAYSASKAALNALGRAAGIELRNTGIHVMTVCPGYIATDFPANVVQGSDRWRLSPSQPTRRSVPASAVAEATLKGYLKNKKEVIVPGRYRGVIRLYQAAPSLIDWSMARMLRPAEQSGSH